MYLQFAVLAAASVLAFGQTSAPGLNIPSAPADLPDVGFLSRSTPLDDLTEQEAVKLEQAARLELDQATARVAEVRALIAAGTLPAQTLDGPADAQVLAFKSYSDSVLRTEHIRQQAALALAESAAATERFDGSGSFTTGDYNRIKAAFEQRFHRLLPVSAEGETAVHRAMGFDHRNRVDVAILPDTAEGRWLRHYLAASAIPYYAFRSRVPGKATAAHIHIGPPSGRASSRSGG